MMKLFFAIPFFKNAPYLKEAIESLIQQTDPAWNVIVFDDSISPAEAQAAQAVVNAFQDERVSYQKNVQNLGMALNWNQGLNYGVNHSDLYSGVTILHGDDRLLPDYVKSYRAQISSYPESIAFFCRTQIIGDAGKKAFSFVDVYKNFLLPNSHFIQLKGIEGVAHLIPGNFVFCPTLCFATKRLQAFRFKPELKMVLDFDLVLSMLLADQVICGIYEKPLYEYRRHALNATNEMNQNLSRFYEEHALYQSLSHHLESRGELKLAKKARTARIVKLNLLFQATKLFLTGHWGALPKHFRLLRELCR